jgi:hypothetical protein
LVGACVGVQVGLAEGARVGTAVGIGVGGAGVSGHLIDTNAFGSSPIAATRYIPGPGLFNDKSIFLPSSLLVKRTKCAPNVSVSHCCAAIALSFAYGQRI